MPGASMACQSSSSFRQTKWDELKVVNGWLSVRNEQIRCVFRQEFRHLNLNMSWHWPHHCTSRTRTLAPYHILAPHTWSLFSPVPHSSLVPGAHVSHISTDKIWSLNITLRPPSQQHQTASHCLEPFPNTLGPFFISLLLACKWFDWSLQKVDNNLSRLIPVQFILLICKVLQSYTFWVDTWIIPETDDSSMYSLKKKVPSSTLKRKSGWIYNRRSAF